MIEESVTIFGTQSSKMAALTKSGSSQNIIERFMAALYNPVTLTGRPLSPAEIRTMRAERARVQIAKRQEAAAARSHRKRRAKEVS